MEITDLTEPQENQVFTAPARIFPPGTKTKNRIFYRTPHLQYNKTVKEEFAMKDEFVARVGVWGQRHYNYLKKKSPAVINVMRLKGTLEQYLNDLNRDTQETYDLMIRQYAEIEGVTEDLKRSDAMEYTRRMNSIRNRVEEFVLHDFVFN